ncbi:MAG: SpoIIE family protein phosphatase, partial [Nocardioidaceae bacterium]
GELHVAVVDVLGHGVTATKDALTVVHTLRFAAVEGTPLEDIVARADILLSAQESELVATVVVARYNPETGELRVVSGGHPPALIVGPGGEVSPVSATGGAIGWPAVGSDNVATVQLGVHDSLILYTDGLIEARKDIIEGMDSLLQVAADVAHLPAQHCADELVRRSLSGADRRDDTLALVLRRTRKSAVADRIRWRLDPGEHGGLRRIRRELQDWVAAHQVEQEDVVLVAAELLANGKAAARSTVVLNAYLETGQVVVEVSDDGPGTHELEDRGRRLPTSESERGRGLYLVRALSDDVTAMSTAEGTVVRATVPVTGITRSARKLHSEHRTL